MPEQTTIEDTTPASGNPAGEVWRQRAASVGFRPGTRERAAAIPVAIIDEDAQVRRLVEDWVERAPGLRWVGSHASARSALASFPARQPAVVVMDLDLPDVSGNECLRELAARMPMAQVLVFTAYEDSNHILDAFERGACGYVLKSVPRAELLAAIRQVHAGGSPMTHCVARKVVQSFHRRRADRFLLGNLTPREFDVLELLARGLPYKKIAATFRISVTTVNTHIRRTCRKLHVHSRAQATAAYIKFLQSRPPSPQPAQPSPPSLAWSGGGRSGMDLSNRSALPRLAGLR